MIGFERESNHDFLAVKRVTGGKSARKAQLPEKIGGQGAVGPREGTGTHRLRGRRDPDKAARTLSVSTKGLARPTREAGLPPRMDPLARFLVARFVVESPATPTRRLARSDRGQFPHGGVTDAEDLGKEDIIQRTEGPVVLRGAGSSVRAHRHRRGVRQEPGTALPGPEPQRRGPPPSRTAISSCGNPTASSGTSSTSTRAASWCRELPKDGATPTAGWTGSSPP